MQLPVNITYRGLKKSLGIEQMVLEKATRLDKFCDHISRCDVAIEQPNHAHKRFGEPPPPGFPLMNKYPVSTRPVRKTTRSFNSLSGPIWRYLFHHNLL